METNVNELGRVLTTKEMAQYLNTNEKTIRKHFTELGGVRLGSRYLFFERNVINALQKKVENRKTGLGCPGEEKRSEETGDLQQQEGSPGLGKRDEKDVRKRLATGDRHGLFGGLGAGLSGSRKGKVC
jgi:excisionase family DNA binding protein